MNVHDAMRTRRTIQRFAPGAVSDEVLARAMEAATYAPNHKLTWPWRFVLPGPTAREALTALNVRLKSTRRALDNDAIEKIRHKMLTPDRLLVVTQQLDPDPQRQLEDYATCAIAIHNLSMSLHADGVGSKWSTGGVTRHRDTYALLGIDSTIQRIVGFIWIGLADTVPEAASRPSWRDVCSSPA